MLTSRKFNKSLEKDLSNHDSFFFCSLSMLLSRNEESLVPEVMYFMSAKQILTLMSAFGGRHVYIPTLKEFSMDMDCSLAAYYRLCQDVPWEDIQEKLEINSGPRMKVIREGVSRWLKMLKEEGMKIPDFVKDDQYG